MNLQIKALNTHETYVHAESNGQYVFIGFAKAKNPDGRWVSCVIYAANTHKYGEEEYYVRSIDDFLEKFVVASEEEPPKKEGEEE